MAKTVLKKTPLHCVVAITGSGTETIDLIDDLDLTTESPEETVTVDIVGITWSVPVGNASVARNSETQWLLTLANAIQMNGWVDNRNNTHDITVVVPVGGGTVVLELVKKDGYGRSQHPYPVGVTTNIDPVN
jgi:hypothetical protein